MSSGVIVLTVGLPGSGKSTLCRNIVENSPVIDSWDIFYISYDAIVDDRKDWLLPDFHWKTERANVLRCVEKMIVQFLLKTAPAVEYDIAENFWSKFINTFSDSNKEKLFLSSSAADKDEKRNFVFLIDDNMYYRSMRYCYYQLARKYRLGFVQLYLPCSSQTAFERNSARPQCQRVTNDVITRMIERLEPPNPELNDWEKKLLQNLSESLTNLPPLLPDNEALAKQKIQSQLQTKESRLHQADLLMRRIISDILKSEAGKGNDLKTLCANLNKTKLDIIGKIRSNIIDQTIIDNPIDLKQLLKDFAGL